MAFTATLTLNFNNDPAATPVTYSQPGCYIRIGNHTGGKEAGAYTCSLIPYVNQATRLNNANDIINFMVPFMPSISTPYVAGVDPEAALYAVAMALYSDAVAVI